MRLYILIKPLKPLQNVQLFGLSYNWNLMQDQKCNYIHPGTQKNGYDSEIQECWMLKGKEFESENRIELWEDHRRRHLGDSGHMFKLCLVLQS